MLEAWAATSSARGGRVVLNAAVEQIVFESGRVAGVRVGGETLPADAVVSTVTTARFLKLASGL